MDYREVLSGELNILSAPLDSTVMLFERGVNESMRPTTNMVESHRTYSDREIGLISAYASTVITTSMLVTDYIQDKGDPEPLTTQARFDLAYENLMDYQEICGDDIYPRIGVHPDAYCTWEKWTAMNEHVAKLVDKMFATNPTSDSNMELIGTTSITITLPLFIGVVVIGLRRVFK